VEGLASGVYRVLVTEREPRLSLQPIRLGQSRAHAAQLALDQALGGDAAVDIYYLSDLGQVLGTYGERGYRLAQMEAAIMAGWGYLAAYALGIGASGLTFYDELVEDFLGVSEDSLKVMFLLAVGVPAKDHR
jgi:nitroreductase